MDPKGFSTDELREPQKARGPFARVAKNMVLVTTSSSTRHHPCMQARAAKLGLLRVARGISFIVVF